MPLNRKYKVLILEDDLEWAGKIQTYINQSEDFKVVLTTNSANEAFMCVKTACPDAVIVDLQLGQGEGDGLDFLKKIHDEKLPVKPYVLVVTSVTSPKTLLKLNNGLADYVHVKNQIGHNPEQILNNLRLMSDIFECNKSGPYECQYDKEKLIRARIIAELDNYYIKQSNIGREFLIDALCMAILSDDMLKSISRNIYPIIGQKYETDKHSVEMAIGRIIQNAFSKTSVSDLRKIYPPYIDLVNGAPTNKEFITYITKKIKSENII